MIDKTVVHPVDIHLLANVSSLLLHYVPAIHHTGYMSVYFSVSQLSLRCQCNDVVPRIEAPLVPADATCSLLSKSFVSKYGIFVVKHACNSLLVCHALSQVNACRFYSIFKRLMFCHVLLK